MKSWCQQVHSLFAGPWEGLFHASALASSSFRHTLASKCITPISAFIVTWYSP